MVFALRETNSGRGAIDGFSICHLPFAIVLQHTTYSIQYIQTLTPAKKTTAGEKIIIRRNCQEPPQCRSRAAKSEVERAVWEGEGEGWRGEVGGYVSQCGGGGEEGGCEGDLVILR